MAYYPIVDKKGKNLSATPRQMLPLGYMEDFSILGFRVNDHRHALEILDRNAFCLRCGKLGPEIKLVNGPQMMKVVKLLHQNGLQCEIADLADDMYQG